MTVVFALLFGVAAGYAIRCLVEVIDEIRRM